MSTPRHNLDTYNQGDDNWSHTDTVEFVDEHSIDRGPVSERPTSGNYDDEFYYATDQNVLWSWDESITDWIIRGGNGSEEQPLESVHTEDLDTPVTPYIPPEIGGMQNPFEFQNEVPIIRLPTSAFTTIKFDKITSTDSSLPIRLQFSTDGGQTWEDNERYFFTYEAISSNSADKSKDSESETELEILPDGDSDNIRTNFPLRLNIPTDHQDRPSLFWSGGFSGPTGRPNRVLGSGAYLESIKPDAIRMSEFETDTGTFEPLQNLRGTIITSPGGAL